MGIQLKNNAVGYLATAITASDTGIVLQSGNGAAFPALGVDEYFYATLESSGGTSEVIKVTSRSGDSLLAVRAQEGTSANSFAAGSRLEMRVTAQSVIDTAQFYANDADANLRYDLAQQTGAGLVGFTPAGIVSAFSVQGAITELAADISAASGSSLIGFVQAGTGAVTSRKVQDKLREFVSVKDFGAVGDGVTDDTAAVQAALTASQSVLFPPNYEFKITDYVTIPDDRYVRVEGTINFYNRRAGFAVVNANNVEIEGTRGSRIYDSAVEANYTFNDPLLGAFAPIVHIRANGAGSKQNFRVHGLRVDHVSVGVFISVADVNNWLAGGLNLSGADFSVACYDVKASDNYFTYVEGVSLAANFAYRTTFDNNYVYRSGDGGIYFINVSQGAITDNVRESPYGNGTSATDINDGQGISVEVSSDIIISRNRVIAFQDHGIDIKNRCSRINVMDNLLVDCQFSSINSRLGDPGSGSGTGDVNYIYITNNEIKNNGFVHTTAFGSMAAIQVDSFYASVVENNKINGLRDCYGIRVTGPGTELVSVFSASPRQSVAIIRNNSILWHAYNYDFSPQFNLDATVKDGIYAEGGYLTKLVVEGNTVFANRYSNADPLSNSAYGIKIDVDTDTNINNHYGWPNSLSVKNNSVYGWLGGGMLITTDFNSVQIAANIEGNKIEYVRAQGLYLYRINGATISNNYVVRADPVGLSIDECKNFIATANQAILSDAAANAGADNQDYGLSVTNSENGLVSYNRFSGNVSATTASGNTNVTLANNL